MQASRRRGVIFFPRHENQTMSKNLMMILVAGVDIWAALLITQIRKTAQPWEVSMAISNESSVATSLSPTTPIQIWMTKNEDIGFWPETSQPLTMQEVRHRLQQQAVQDPSHRLEVRLLCDPSLTIQQWGHLALALSRHAEEIRIAPLPE